MNGLARLSLAILIPIATLFLGQAAAVAHAQDPAAISGVLKGRDGATIVGTIEYRSFAEPSKTGMARTDDKGAFVIKDLAVGHYELTGRADGANWGIVTTTAQAGARELEFKLAPGHSVTGKVPMTKATRELGKAPEVRVVAQPLREEVSATSALVAADGTFTLDRIAQTACVLYATTDDGWISRPHPPKGREEAATHESHMVITCSGLTEFGLMEIEVPPCSTEYDEDIEVYQIDLK